MIWWYHIIQYDIILYNMISYYTIWYHIVLYYIILYYIILYYIILYYILDRSRVEPGSIQARSWIDPGSIQDRSRICLLICFICFMCFFPWPMYKRCAAKNNHRRLENKGELPTTSKWCSKCQQCNLPIIFAGRCSLQGQKSWPKCAFYWCFCKMT